MLRQPGCAGRWPALHGEQVKPGNVHQRRAQADGGRWPALHGEQVKPGNVHQRRAQADGGRWPALHGEQVKPSGWCITHHCPLVPPFAGIGAKLGSYRSLLFSLLSPHF